MKSTQQYILPKFTLAIFDNIVDNRSVLINKIHHRKESVSFTLDKEKKLQKNYFDQIFPDL